MKKEYLKDVFQYALAGVIVWGFFMVLFKILNITIPQANEKLIYLLLGTLATLLTQVVSYFFASNKDSARKTDMIYNSTPPTPPSEPDKPNTP